jgi:hypothetical protein
MLPTSLLQEGGQGGRDEPLNREKIRPRGGPRPPVAEEGETSAGSGRSYFIVIVMAWGINKAAGGGGGWRWRWWGGGGGVTVVVWW